MLSETGWHQEQELIHFDRQSVGIDCTILILSPDQCSPKPNVDSFGSNDKLRQNVSKTPEMVNLEILHPAVDRWDPKSDHLVQQHSAPFGFPGGDWIPWIAMDANWKGRLRAAAAACRRFRRAVAEHHIWQKRFDLHFVNGGGILPLQQSAPAETWTCDTCSKSFASEKALATHAGRAHGYRRVVKYYAIGDTCHACCKWYHSRQRFIEHLKFVPSCLDVLQACFPALDDASVQTMDQADHAHTLSMRQQGWWATKALLPVRRVQGPMLPPAGSQDASVLKQKWEQRLEPSGTAFMNLQGRRTDGSADDPQVLLFEDYIPPFVFQSAAGPNQGDGHFAASNLAREHARLHIKTLVFVHVFSGFRRENDLHQLLEHQIWGALHFFVISIDMCMQKIEGNLASSKAFQFWMHQIATGQVCGMGGGPPCETFTAARLIEGGPPPLRSGSRTSDSASGNNALSALGSLGSW